MRFIFKLFVGLSVQFSLYALPSAAPNTCLKCHGNREPNFGHQYDSFAPQLDPQFSMNWLLYEFKGKPPPLEMIPTPYQVMRGQTHYDWPERKMTEIYFDRCINIFPKGNNFSCQFISDHDKTYLIKSALGKIERPSSCCLLSNDAFWAPRPDVLAIMNFQKQTFFDGEPIDWWIYDIPLPGPFGYGVTKEHRRPVAFWFPVINAWAQQNFSDYLSEKPDPRVFALPKHCRGKIEICDLLPK